MLYEVTSRRIARLRHDPKAKVAAVAAWRAKEAVALAPDAIRPLPLYAPSPPSTSQLVATVCLLVSQHASDAAVPRLLKVASRRIVVDNGVVGLVADGSRAAAAYDVDPANEDEASRVGEFVSNPLHDH